MFWKRKKPLAYWAADIEQVNKENNSNWWQKHFKSCEEKPQNISQWYHNQSPQGRGEGISMSRSEKTWRAAILRLYHRMQTTRSVISIGRWDYNFQRYRDEAQKFWNKVVLVILSIKLMERPRCRERRGLLMFQNIRAHLWSTVEEVSLLGLVWLLLEWAH